jgi:hypothetical protein
MVIVRCCWKTLVEASRFRGDLLSGCQLDPGWANAGRGRMDGSTKLMASHQTIYVYPLCATRGNG